MKLTHSRCEFMLFDFQRINFQIDLDGSLSLRRFRRGPVCRYDEQVRVVLSDRIFEKRGRGISNQRGHVIEFERCEFAPCDFQTRICVDYFLAELSIRFANLS